MRSHALAFPGAALASAAAAGAATLALRPRRGVLRAIRVNATAYFSASELDRARAYQRPRRRLGALDSALTAAALTTIALRPPEPLRAALERSSRRPLLAGAAVSIGLSLGLRAISLPLAIVSERRARRFGLSTQTWGPWTADLAKATAISTVLTGGAGAGALAVVRRFPRTWWLPASAAATGFGALFTFVAPVLLDPIFNRYTPLEDGALRSDVLELAERAGIKVKEVYHVDASRRTTAANAYVGGLGNTRRVVLFDTLINEFPPAEIRSVIAHELAHVKNRDVVRLLVWLALTSPAAALAVERLTERIYTGRAGDPAMIPAASLAASIVSVWLGVLAGALSRRVEARADAFALELTDDPDALIGVERRLTTQNLADPDPPKWLRRLFGTHPPTIERIGYALAWREGSRPEPAEKS